MDLTILRIYMTFSAKVNSNQLTLWQRLFNSSLAFFMLKKAKEAGLEQALVQKIPGGYLKGKKLVFDMSEVAPAELPQCVELIDTEQKLISFVEKYREQLKDCKIVILKALEVLK